MRYNYTFQHEPTNSICWTVHRPIHGWYIRLRSPSFPPETYISLSPVSHKSFLYVEGALSFTSRTNSLSTFVMPVDEEEHRRFSLASPSQPRMSMSSIMTIRSTKTTRTVQSSSTERAHSYPPIPSGPTVNVLPPSPKSVASRLSRRSSSSSTYSASSSQSSPSTIRPSTQTQLSTFILSPTINQIPLPASNSYFARAISLFQYHRPRQNNSFTLSRIPAPMPQYISPAPSMSNLDLPNSGAAALVNQNTDEVSDDTRTVTLDSQEDPSMRDIHIPPLLRVSVSGPPAHSPSSSSLSPSYPVSSSLSPSTPSPDSSAPPPLSLPLVMRFVDETPIFTVGSTMGAFELDQTEVKALGIDMSYWIAVGLTYLDFLENKAVSHCICCILFFLLNSANSYPPFFPCVDGLYLELSRRIGRLRNFSTLFFFQILKLPRLSCLNVIIREGGRNTIGHKSK